MHSAQTDDQFFELLTSCPISTANLMSYIMSNLMSYVMSNVMSDVLRVQSWFGNKVLDFSSNGKTGLGQAEHFE